MTRNKATTTAVPCNDNFEDLPALPKHIDTWISDVVSSAREPEAYEATVVYVTELMVEWGEDGTQTFEEYAPYVAGFLDGWTRRGKMNATTRQSVPVEVRSLLPDN